MSTHARGGAQYQELDGRQRIAALADPDSFVEFLAPTARLTSPYLQELDQPVELDDGVIIGRARLRRKKIYVLAQQGAFVGGSVGEIHGAKITGLIKAANRDRIPIVLLLESGGVRLHEGSSGEIGIAEAIRAIFECRAAKVPTVAVIGADIGAYGGVGIMAACCEYAVITEHGRWGVSGPIVIEKWMGVEEYDSEDRRLVWRTSGGRTRYALGDADCLADNDPQSVKLAVEKYVRGSKPLSLASLKKEQAGLAARLTRFGKVKDPAQIWRAAGVKDAQNAGILLASEFAKQVKKKGAWG